MSDTRAASVWIGKDIPPEAARRSLRLAAAGLTANELSWDELAMRGRELLRRLGLSEAYLGFAMVELHNAASEHQFAAVPFDRRLLLLPQCLRHAAACRGQYAEGELRCAACGACPLAKWAQEARALGYRVLIAEGTPAVLRIFLDEDCDALLGVACLEVMEKAFAPVRRLSVPHLAVPLLRPGCQNTCCDEERLRAYLHLRLSGGECSSYLPLLRETQQMFRLPMLRRLLPGWLDLDAAAALWREPQAAAARLALEWLMESGKRLRPFLCLAAYAGRRGLLSAACAEEIADSVRRVALALEIMHKASLAHDDIEDEDEQRYGRPTLHRRSSVGEALNAGDLLVGLGYGLIAAAAEGLGARCASDILERLAKAHLRLCRGQGRELAWQREWLAAPRPFSPAEVLTIYAAKTSPAFEICLYAGLRMAGDWQDEALVQAFATALGIAFQIANDSEHWQSANPGCRGGDAWAGRPTLHLAFALEADADAVRCLWRRRPAGTQSAEMAGWLAEVEKLYHQTAAFAQADALRRKYRHRALALAREFEPQPLADLCAFAVRLALGV